MPVGDNPKASHMTRIMANWEADADITIPDATPFIRYEHPQGAYIVFLRKAPPEDNNPLKLSLQVICDAASLSEAEEITEAHAKEFLDYLSYASNLRTRLGRPQQIFDWEPISREHGMRDALYYHTSPADKPPFAAIEPHLLETIALLQRTDVDARLRRALKWFSSGIGAQYQDDQFTFFWFVIELVAQIAKDVSPVPTDARSVGSQCSARAATHRICTGRIQSMPLKVYSKKPCGESGKYFTGERSEPATCCCTVMR
jgi:hypothetical protein